MLEFTDCKPSIKELYNSRFSNDKQFKISAKFSESCVLFGIVLTGSDKTPDCKVPSFAENIYFRTQNGVNRKEYKSIKNIENAIKNKAKEYGYTLEKLVIEVGEPDIL